MFFIKSFNIAWNYSPYFSYPNIYLITLYHFFLLAYWHTVPYRRIPSKSHQDCLYCVLSLERATILPYTQSLKILNFSPIIRIDPTLSFYSFVSMAYFMLLVLSGMISYHIMSYGIMSYHTVYNMMIAYAL